MISIDKFANKKDPIFWETTRPIPLTVEEKTDYQKKDSLSIIRTSKPYLDSIDRKHNKFKASDIIKGYTFKIDDNNNNLSEIKTYLLSQFV